LLLIDSATPTSCKESITAHTKLLCHLAVLYDELQQRENAIETFEALTLLDPGHVEAHIATANLPKDSNWRRAEYHYKQVIAHTTKPSHDHHVNLALLYKSNGL
jgi:hypothetical protein